MKKYLQTVWNVLCGGAHNPRYVCHWRMLLLSTAGVLVLVAIWSVTLFILVSSGELFFISDPVEGQSTIDRSALTETLQTYQQRAVEHEALKSASPAVADPSR